MTPDEYCQTKAAASGSNLVAAFRILPPQPRAAVTAVYAFCREVDDVVDECSEPQLAAVKLAWWKTEVERLFENRPEHPVGQALLPAVRRFDLPRACLEDIIAGCQMDITQNRYATWTDLDAYCDKVAGAVALLCARIFGTPSPATLDYALMLGRALQYTNIIRDVGEDARRGRIYLPAQAISEHGVDPASILRCEHSKPFEALLADMSRRAHQLYDQAIATLPSGERSQQRPGLIMAAVYRELLRLVESESFRVLDQRISVAPARKAWLAWRTSIGFMPA